MSRFHERVAASTEVPHLRNTSQNAEEWRATISTRLGTGSNTDWSRHQFLAGETTAARHAFQALLTAMDERHDVDTAHVFDLRYIMFDENQRALLRYKNNTAHPRRVRFHAPEFDTYGNAMFVCLGCGRVWDGNAQCYPCPGGGGAVPQSWVEDRYTADSDDDEESSDDWSSSTHEDAYETDVS